MKEAGCGASLSPVRLFDLQGHRSVAVVTAGYTHLDRVTRVNESSTPSRSGLRHPTRPRRCSDLMWCVLVRRGVGRSGWGCLADRVVFLDLRKLSPALACWLSGAVVRPSY
jgi:hypothetical protein